MNDKTFCFGNSFVEIFEFFKKNVKVYKYQGATIKGLLKENNANTKHIKYIINTYSPKVAIFVFGEVDINHSFYYDAIVKNTINDETYYDKLAYDYVSFIKNLNIQTPLIINTFPHPVKLDNIIQSLKYYKIINDKDIEIYKNNTSNHSIEYLFKDRDKRVKFFNDAIKKHCHGTNIQFIELNKHIHDKNYNIYKQFIMPISYEMHLLFKPVAELLAKKNNKYHIVKSNLII
jgi:hypothetical protein